MAQRVLAWQGKSVESNTGILEDLSIAMEASKTVGKL
jgi:hypothetical protein